MMLKTDYNKLQRKSSSWSDRLAGALDQQEELQLDRYLEQLNYNEQDHALARSEVERWRWQKFGRGKSKMPRGDKRF